jgi:hypothetical protein
MLRFSSLGRMSLLGLAFALILGEVSIAAAQTGRRSNVRRYKSSTQEPSISPYLNLLRGGADPGFNYFTLVQPQMQNQSNLQLQNRDIQTLGRQLQQDERQGPFGALTQIRATGGRAASFQNYSHYYPGMGGGGGGGGGGSPARNYPSPGSGGGGMMGGMGMGGGF